MFDRYEAEAEVTLQAVRQAAMLCARIQAQAQDAPLEKSDQSPVTVADFASQAVVARRLLEAFPDDLLVAEEGGADLLEDGRADTLRAVTEHVAGLYPEAEPNRVLTWIDRGLSQPGDRFWVLDPIDGTQGFLRGDQYVVALALIENGQVVLGALGCPRLDRTLRPADSGGGCRVIAVRGKGAWATGMNALNFERLQVSKVGDPAQARVLQSYEAAHTDMDKLDELRQALKTEAPPVRMDSQAKFAVLAAGHGDLLLRLLSPHRPDYREKIWDQAAGSIVVTEAGGTVSDLRGKPLNFAAGRELRDNVGVLVSNGLLHGAALEALELIGANGRPESR